MNFLKDFHNEIKVLIAISIIAIVVSIGLIFVLKSLSSPTQIQPPDSQQVSVEAQPTEESTEIDTSDWQTYRNEEFGFQLKYSKDWNLEPIKGYSGLIANIRESLFTYVTISSIPIEAGQEMLDVVSINTGIGECGPECPPVPEDKISIRAFGENSFYYVFDNLFEGQYAVTYYIEDPNKDRAVRFQLSDFTKSGKNWTDPGYDVDAEPNHEILKQILSTFRFIEPIDTSDWEAYSNEEFGFEIKYPSRWTFDVPQVREEEPYLIIGFETLTPDSVSVGFQMSIYDSDPGDPDPSTQCTKTGKTITVSGKEYEKCLYLVGEGALAGWYLTIVNKGFIYDFEVDDSDIPDEVISTLQFIE